MGSDDVTPAELARELGVDAKRIRAYLRSQFGRLENGETRWRLETGRADLVRSHFATRST